MRKIIFGAAVAALMFSACEVIEPQDTLLPEDVTVSGSGAHGGAAQDSVIFTATIGADTKTLLQWSEESQTYKTIWSDGDVISVKGDYGDWAQFNIVDGVGTTTAKFKGAIEESSRYIAVYGSGAWGNYDECGVFLYNWQWMEGLYGAESFGTTTSPMVARSSTKSFEFKNVCSLLRVSLTGNGEELKSVTFMPHDPEVRTSGLADIQFDGGEPYISWISGDQDSVFVSSWGALSETKRDCFIVLPPGEYKGGFDLTIRTDQGYMAVSTAQDITLKRSEVRTVTVAYTTQATETWYMEGWFEDREYLQMLPEGDMFVLRNIWLGSGQDFYFRNGSDTAQLRLDYKYGRYFPTNTRCSLTTGSGNWLYNRIGGYYDIYLDLQNQCAFIMSAGVPISELPTTEDVAQWDFWDIESLEDGTEIKVNGTVYAVYEDGFIIVLGGDEYALFVACSDLDVSMGQNIDIYGVKATVNGMPVVTGVVSTFFVNSLDINLYFNNITSDFAWWSSSIYSNIRYVGIYSAATNTVTVEGVEDKLGRVIKQNQDYSALDGQRVVVDGYSAGMEYSADGSMTYLNTIVVRMAKVEGSSTEDVVPGDELPII